MSRPDKISKISGARPAAPRTLHTHEHRTTARTRDEKRAAVAATAGAHWRPDPNLEGLRRLRDSDRPKDRATFNRIAAGGNRIHLHDYEQALRAHLAAGGDLPEGVVKP